MTRQVTALLTGVLVLLLSGCQLLASSTDAAEHFADPAVRETAEAIASGDAKRVRELIQEGVPVNSTGADGVTLLQWAVFEGTVGTFETLLDLGADVAQPGLGGSTAVHSAATVDSVEFLQMLLDRGASPDIRHAVTDQTPLMRAVGPRTHDHLVALLDAGADVTLTDRTGNSALHLAAMLNAGEHVLLLLEAGADPEATNAQESTFQPYFWRTDADIMSDEALEERRLVAEWLTHRGIPLHENARWTRA